MVHREEESLQHATDIAESCVANAQKHADFKKTCVIHCNGWWAFAISPVKHTTTRKKQEKVRKMKAYASPAGPSLRFGGYKLDDFPRSLYLASVTYFAV